MSLKIDFDICLQNNCSQLLFNETTGSYSVANLTGYGTPNPDYSACTAASLEVTGPDNIKYTIDMLAEGFPTNDKTITYPISNSDIGSPTTIVDGKWTFKYSVTDISGNVYTKTRYKLFYCSSEYCVKTYLSNIKVSTCDCCSDKKLDDYIKVSTFLDSLKNAAKCGDIDSFTDIKKIVDKLCNNSGCKTCK